MSNTNSKSGGLKVVYKHDADSMVPQRVSSDNSAWATGESLVEMIDRILKGFYRFKAALWHQFERIFGPKESNSYTKSMYIRYNYVIYTKKGYCA